MLKLVVGLGNPGAEHERARHNVGFRLVDHLVGEAGFFGSNWTSFNGLGLALKRLGTWFVKPTTYMNESGHCVGAFARYHKIAPSEMLIVFDELALPLGKIRIRSRGSAGGQKGMLSVIEQLGTEEIPRMRLGIGPQPDFMDSAAFVLAKFSRAEESALSKVLDIAAGAVEEIKSAGLESAMNRFNSNPEPPDKKL